ncbi:MAG: hypothetical protein HW388_1229, partial [Dehalococcoidia bacterium]|nr:hypothetical protein [Dehalococcoidia bacterium]
MTQPLIPRDVENCANSTEVPGSLIGDERKFVESVLYFLKAPVIVWPSYEDDFRDRWDQVLLHRLAHAREVFAQKECTEFEAMLYVSSASLVHPLTHEWAEIYFWLFRRWRPEAAVDNDIGGHELDPQEREELARLRRCIFKGQMLHLKGQRAPGEKE